MKFYDLDSVFTFGKFEGKTVREILDLDPTYIDWCSINLDHFYIDDDVIEEIQLILPAFSISEEGQSKLFEKYQDWEAAQAELDEQEEYNDYDYYDNYNDREADIFDALTDGQYGDYDDWKENGGDIDSLKDSLGF